MLRLSVHPSLGLCFILEKPALGPPLSGALWAKVIIEKARAESVHGIAILAAADNVNAGFAFGQDVAA
jgi:hypothetical protein